MSLDLILGELSPKILHVLLNIFPVPEAPPTLESTNTYLYYRARAFPGTRTSWGQIMGSQFSPRSSNLREKNEESLDIQYMSPGSRLLCAPGG